MKKIIILLVMILNACSVESDMAKSSFLETLRGVYNLNDGQEFTIQTGEFFALPNGTTYNLVEIYFSDTALYYKNDSVYVGLILKDSKIYSTYESKTPEDINTERIFVIAQKK